jgi:putative tryptophan/tyrosine transport system substrate-binding protein
MRRREFIALLGSGVAGWSLAARAQQAAMPVVGFLNGGSPDANRVAAFRQGLNETGYIEGRNLAIEYHWAEGQYDRLPALAADLVRRQVTVVAATTTPAAIAAKAATTTIPIVFTTSSDPVQLGLAASLSRPGGNLTGATTLQIEVTPKRLEILHELVPTANVFALLVNPANPYTEILSRNVQAAARILGLQLHILHASTEHDFDKAFVSLNHLRSAGLVIGGAEVFFDSWSAQLATLTVRHGIPTIYQGREFVVAGGLMSYGGSIMESYRVAGSYTGRILKGEKPADLPVQQATKIEFIINVKAAKALGLAVPLTVLARADEVIE